MPVTPNPVLHPLGAPVINGSEITVDMMLQQPTRITRMIADMTLQRFIADRVFASGGGVTGGAVVYDAPTANDLYSDRDVERVAPLGEFPIITSSNPNPQVALPEKWGGKFQFSDESKDRNNSVVFTNELRRLGNTIVRKINNRCVEVLDAAITAAGGSATFVGHAWSTAIPNGATPTAPALTPLGDVVKANVLADIDEMGIVFDTMILNPLDKMSLINFYGPNGWRTALAEVGITDVYSSNRKPAGSAFILAGGQVGEMRIESPLKTVTWREEKTESTWTQTGVRPLFFVNNIMAIRKITGIA